MPPGWIPDLYAYWQWLERQVRESGGYLAARDYLQPDAYYPTEDPDDTHIEVLDIRDHRLIFYSGHFLKFTITANSDLEVIFYEYHFAEIGGERPTIWRACKNGHREEQLDSATHVHVGEETVLPSGEVDFDEAIQAVHDRIPPGLD